MAPRMAQTLDKLQASFAKIILGCRQVPRIKWQALRVCCGWDLKLSSKVVLAAIMALSRLQLMPESHPGARMLAVAWAIPCAGWVATVKGLMADPTLHPPIVDSLAHHSFTEFEVLHARTCKEQRRLLLKRYRNDVVLPALRERDHRLYSQSV